MEDGGRETVERERWPSSLSLYIWRNSPSTFDDVTDLRDRKPSSDMGRRNVHCDLTIGQIGRMIKNKIGGAAYCMWSLFIQIFQPICEIASSAFDIKSWSERNKNHERTRRSLSLLSSDLSQNHLNRESGCRVTKQISSLSRLFTPFTILCGLKTVLPGQILDIQ
jgi:hypothetical protein